MTDYERLAAAVAALQATLAQVDPQYADLRDPVWVVMVVKYNLAKLLGVEPVTQEDIDDRDRTV